jgi:hypothetical protein
MARAEGRSVKNDMLFAAETHRRWMTRRNRRQEDPAYRDEWRDAQCGHCRFWVPLSGALGADYGACTNPASSFDGRAQFEHDGCDEFEPSESWTEPDP